MYALVDGNNFFVSCERVFNPKLWGVPIVVLSNNDGCIIARSQEAKSMGIPMGAPFYQCKQKLTKAGGKWFSANFPLYGDMSNRMIQVLEELIPRVEVYSVDESFCDVSGLTSTALQAKGEEIKMSLDKWLGLPVCVGIAPTKTLAKVANDLAKKHTEFNSVALLDTKEKRSYYLKQMDIARVWGIGERTALKLRPLGIKTAYDLSVVNPSFMRNKFNVVMERMALEMRGIPCLEMEDITPPKKQIIASRSFSKKLTDIKPIEEAVATYITRAAEKLRQQGSMCGCVGVFLRTNRFSEQEDQYRASTYRTLPIATDDTSELIKEACTALGQIYQQGYRYHKVGIILTSLCEKGALQENLFTATPDPRKNNLMSAIDSLNQKYGSRLITHAATGIKADWMMRSGYRSPAYTTDWNNLLTVNL